MKERDGEGERDSVWGREKWEILYSVEYILILHVLFRFGSDPIRAHTKSKNNNMQ